MYVTVVIYDNQGKSSTVFQELHLLVLFIDTRVFVFIGEDKLAYIHVKRLS